MRLLPILSFVSGFPALNCGQANASPEHLCSLVMLLSVNILTPSLVNVRRWSISFFCVFFFWRWLCLMSPSLRCACVNSSYQGEGWEPRYNTRSFCSTQNYSGGRNASSWPVVLNLPSPKGMHLAISPLLFILCHGVLHNADGQCVFILHLHIDCYEGPPGLSSETYSWTILEISLLVLPSLLGIPRIVPVMLRFSRPAFAMLVFLLNRFTLNAVYGSRVNIRYVKPL